MKWSIEDLFLSYAKKNGECILWTGALRWNGYGIIKLRGEKRKAHRVSYEIFKGQIPKGKFVLHKCDNRNCVNPKHLWVGTHTQNQIDCNKKGRRPHGERHYKSQYNNKFIRKIKYAIAKVDKWKRGARWYLVSAQVIGAKFGIDPMYVNSIRKSRTYKRI